jgi:hypothetical protein
VQAQAVSQDWVNASESAAQSYWGNPYPPTRPCVAVPTLTQEPLAGAEGGEADYDNCAIVLNSDNAWTPYTFCIAYLHEWGHLTLGPMYFEASNPADPAHSLDPTSIMQESEAIYDLEIPQCFAADAAVAPPPPSGPPTVGPVTVASTAVGHPTRRRHERCMRARLGRRRGCGRGSRQHIA